VDDINSRPPDAVNAEGTKWWTHKGLMEWATRDVAQLPPLPNLKAWTVETSTGYRAFVLTYKNKIVWDGEKLDAAACHIDMLRMTQTP